MLLESNEVTPEVDFDLKWVANSMYASSIDTVRSSSLFCVNLPFFFFYIDNECPFY